MTGRRLLRLVLALGVAATTAAAPDAGAVVPPGTHARLNASTPAADAVVAQAPRVVVLTFNRDIAPPAYVVVTAPGGDRVGTGDPTVRGPVVTAPVAPHEQGSYLVAYRAVSVDGHPITGRFVFSVGHRSAVHDPAARSAPATGGTPWAVAAAAGGLVVAGAGLWTWRRRRRSG